MTCARFGRWLARFHLHAKQHFQMFKTILIRVFQITCGGAKLRRFRLRGKIGHSSDMTGLDLIYSACRAVVMRESVKHRCVEHYRHLVDDKCETIQCSCTFLAKVSWKCEQICTWSSQFVSVTQQSVLLSKFKNLSRTGRVNLDSEAWHSYWEYFYSKFSPLCVSNTLYNSII